MMEYLIVVFSVSIDAYLAGFAYSVGKRLTFLQTLYVGSFTFFVSLIMLIVGAYLKGITLINYLGALIFIAIGCKNYLCIYEQNKLLKPNTVNNTTLLGIGISIDAGVACLAVAVEGVMIIWCAFVMFLGHFLFLLLGALTVKMVGVIERASFLSGVLMIFWGLIKLFCLTG